MTLTTQINRMSSEGLTELRHQIQDRLFGAEDSISLERATLVTEAWREHTHCSMPLRRAKALAHILRHGSIHLDANPVFAGTTSEAPRAWVLFPEYGVGVDEQLLIEQDGFEGFCDQALPEEMEDYWSTHKTTGGNAGPGHLAVDYQAVVDRGLINILQEVSEAEHGHEDYQTAMQIVLEAVMHWSERHAEHAKCMANEMSNGPVLAALGQIESSCLRVPALPATNLHEALQSLLIVHHALVLEGQGTSLSIGRLDKILEPFEHEIKDDPAYAAELIGCALLSITANSFQGRASKTQAVTIGGPDASPMITEVILDAFERTPVADPHLFLRWHASIDERVRQKAIAMLSAGRSMPLLVADEQVIPGLLACGIGSDDAHNYAMIGCNEVGVAGVNWSIGITSGTYHNDLDLLMRALNHHELLSTDDIVKAWGEELKSFMMEGVAKHFQWRRDRAGTHPMPLTTALFKEGPRRGEDYLLLPGNEAVGSFTRGTTNLVNALAAIHALVFKEERAELKEMLRRLEQNDSRMIELCAHVVKWGNDDPEIDQWVDRVNQVRGEVCREVAEHYGLPALSICHVVRSLHHVDGLKLGATPDGRKAGEPLADSIGAECGTTTEGPTAILNSVLNVNPFAFTGVYNFNLSLVGSQAKAPILDAMVSAFFDAGGQELQVGVLDANKLRAAQENPEGFGDLVVRIAGLNARFIELSQREQEEVIKRAECA